MSTAARIRETAEMNGWAVSAVADGHVLDITRRGHQVWVRIGGHGGIASVLHDYQPLTGAGRLTRVLEILGEGSTSFATLDLAARAYGAAHGITGQAGGWVRSADGKALAHGWRDLGMILVQRGAIDPQDEDGQSVRRRETRTGIVIMAERRWLAAARRWALTWREI